MIQGGEALRGHRRVAEEVAQHEVPDPYTARGLGCDGGHHHRVEGGVVHALALGPLVDEVVGYVDDVVAELFDELRLIAQAAEIAEAEAELDAESHPLALSQRTDARRDADSGRDLSNARRRPADRQRPNSPSSSSSIAVCAARLAAFESFARATTSATSVSAASSTCASMSVSSGRMRPAAAAWPSAAFSSPKP